MQLYLANHAYVADADALNDDRDTINVEDLAMPIVAYIWTEASFPAGFEKAKADIQADYTEMVSEEGREPPVFRWELADAEDTAHLVNTTAWELWDDANEHTRVLVLVVEVRDVA